MPLLYGFEHALSKSSCPMRPLSTRTSALAPLTQLPEEFLPVDRLDATVLEIVVSAVERLSHWGHVIEVTG
jgi:hypothetical protein